MSTRQIQKGALGTESSPSAITDTAAGKAIVRNFSRAAGLIYDRASHLFRYNGNDAIKTLVSEDGTQTLTNKTFTSPASTGSVLTSPLGVVTALETLLTQIAGNKTHTASFVIPAGATIVDIFITGSVVWNSGTTATLKAGISGGDDDCFFTGLDLKTIPAAGKSINFSHPGGANGASVPAIDGGAHLTQLGATSGFLYSATAQTIDVIVTDVNAAGTNGRTRVTVLYSRPSAVIAPVVA